MIFLKKKEKKDTFPVIESVEYKEIPNKRIFKKRRNLVRSFTDQDK